MLIFIEYVNKISKHIIIYLYDILETCLYLACHKADCRLGFFLIL